MHAFSFLLAQFVTASRYVYAQCSFSKCTLTLDNIIHSHIAQNYLYIYRQKQCCNKSMHRKQRKINEGKSNYIAFVLLQQKKSPHAIIQNEEDMQICTQIQYQNEEHSTKRAKVLENVLQRHLGVLYSVSFLFPYEYLHCMKEYFNIITVCMQTNAKQ